MEKAPNVELVEVFLSVSFMRGCPKDMVFVVKKKILTLHIKD